ncbi:hypothetical protein OG792_20520 [Micromonospora sp. NBC_01699]|uniref:hypothetical protein n=1 Tax=Micromonospora sp. NBC_01699 TaxID=2975984 RepID=UPI002E2B652F|nr:hypothetical protein [Micromonospora sp. NBC_01699]
MTVEDIAVLAGAGLVPLATARAGRAPNAAPHRQIPSLYADPASWLVLEAVDELWAGCPDAVRAAPETTAMVLVSTYSTIDTMSAIARAVPGGRLSPLRFAGASAGGPVSLVCQVHGFRGPTLVITSAPEDGCPAAWTMARHWLRTGAASHVVVAVHDHDSLRGHEVRCVVVGAAPGRHPSGGPR